jgi:hypothetical protein
VTEKYQEFRVVLRHKGLADSATEGPDFIAIVSGRDAEDARMAAEKLVVTLHGLVRIVSIDPRPDDDRHGWA